LAYLGAYLHSYVVKDTFFSYSEIEASERYAGSTDGINVDFIQGLVWVIWIKINLNGEYLGNEDTEDWKNCPI
jgi:hypothetical protein